MGRKRKESSAEIIYGKKENTPEMVTISDVRLDLFLFFHAKKDY